MAKRNDLAKGTYITGLPQLEGDVPLGTGQEYSYRVPITPGALPVPQSRGGAPSVTITQQPSLGGGTTPELSVNIPADVTKPVGSSGQITSDVANAANQGGQQANIDLIREALGAKEPGYTNLATSRFRAGPQGFLQQGYAPSGNSWMWFTGGSPYPVQEAPQYVDALGELVKNITSTLDYEQAKRKKAAEEAQRQARTGGGGVGAGGQSTPGLSPEQAYANMFGQESAPTGDPFIYPRLNKRGF